jgi:hypothetical protein
MEPDGYAVVQTDGNFVGAWKSKDLADKIVNRSPSVKGEAVRAIYFAAPPRSTEPTEEQWGGLARDIMMWIDCYEGPKRTPRSLFRLLEATGRDIPQWLRDEPEMQHLDHVPSKGTRCAIIYKAMLTASGAGGEEKA